MPVTSPSRRNQGEAIAHFEAIGTGAAAWRGGCRRRVGQQHVAGPLCRFIAREQLLAALGPTLPISRPRRDDDAAALALRRARGADEQCGGETRRAAEPCRGYHSVCTTSMPALASASARAFIQPLA